MGLRASSSIFQRISACLSSVWAARAASPQGYFNPLHGFLMAGPPGSTACDASYHCLLSLCTEVGFPVKDSSCVPPRTRLTFMGPAFDTVAQEFRPFRFPAPGPGVAGLLTFGVVAVPALRLFRRRLYSSTVGLASPFSRRPVSDLVRQDSPRLGALFAVLQRRFPDLRPPSPLALLLLLRRRSPRTWTSFAPGWTLGAWPFFCRSRGSATFELFSILVALQLWGPEMRRAALQVESDTQVVVTVVINPFATDPLLVNILRRVAALLLQCDFSLRAVHSPGVTDAAAAPFVRGYTYPLSCAFSCCCGLS